MGKPNSKSASNVGDPQVQILNQLDVHSEKHSEHEKLLIIILVLVGVQLSITLYKIYKEHSRTQALKAANSVAKIQNI